MAAVLTIKNLNKSFGWVQAVNDVSFEVPQKSVFGLLGPNGSGKTTTLGIVLDVIRRDSGMYSWFGADSSKTEKSKIGAILETPNFYPYLTGYQNLKIVADIKGVNYNAIDPILDKVNLLARKNSKFQTYSLGMKQRLAIGSALLCNPEVLVLDEPTNGLDPEGINEVRTLIKNIASEGKTIVLASHLLDEVEKVCSHVGILKSGTLLEYGSVDEILSDEILIEIGSYNRTILIESVRSLKYLKIIDEQLTDGRILVSLVNDQQNVANINRDLMERGVILTHLVIKRKSLEDQFLEIVKD